jgi:hypothetical protein
MRFDDRESPVGSSKFNTQHQFLLRRWIARNPRCQLVNRESGAARRRVAPGQTQEFRRCPAGTQSGVLTGEAKAALAEGTNRLSVCLFWCVRNWYTSSSGIRARQRLHRRNGCGRGSAHVADPHGRSGIPQSAYGNSWRHTRPRTIRSSSKFTKCRPVRPWSSGKSCPRSRPPRSPRAATAKARTRPFGQPASVPASAGA